MTINIDEILKTGIERRASDIHLKVGNPPVLRIDGSLYPMVEQSRLNQESVISIAFGIMNNMQKQKFKEKNEIDLAYSVPGLGRFRVNAFQQRGTIGLVFRVVPSRIMTIEELNLPQIIEKLTVEERGLLLVTGSTGSGKSTTLAAMIDHINTEKTRHIVTIEDPIEFLHRDKKSIVNQREVGEDTESFAVALRSALRQDPDVILVGEMRDFETIVTALIAAETGHLVLSTLHTIDAKETINRIIAVFPPYQQRQLRLQLASVLKGIVSMRLVPRADGKGRVPAAEVMIATTTIKECIIDADKTKRIPEIIVASTSQYGMQTFDQSLFSLFQRELITYEEALKQCTNPEDFALKVKGIQSTSDFTWAAQGEGQGSKKDDSDFNIERFSK